MKFAEIRIDVGEVFDFGQTALGHRRMVPILGGSVEGEIGEGVVLPGTDWQWVQLDGSLTIDAHYALQMTDGTLVEIVSRGSRFTDANAKVVFRTAVSMLCNRDRPEINQRVFVAIGTRLEREVLLTISAVA